MKNDNVTSVLSFFITSLNVPITRRGISQEIKRHPDYYSISAFEDVLHHFGIKSGVYKVPFVELNEVSLPFIAHLRNRQYAVVTTIDNQTVTLSNDQWRNHQMSLKEFKFYYGGTVLITEDSSMAAEPDYAKKRSQELLENFRRPFGTIGLFIGLLLVFIFNSTFFQTITVYIALLTAIKTIGLAISIMLLIQTVDTNNALIQKFCGTNSHKNCNAILSSEAAKFGLLSWSEVGFFYFAGTWLILLLNSNQPGAMGLLAMLNLISLPYTFYSIYYQWRMAKQWCIFCCAVQGLLWLEFFSFFTYKDHLSIPSITQLGMIMVAMVIPVFAWILARPYLLQITQSGTLNEQLRNFKYDRQIFEGTLKNQPKYSLPEEEWSIVLGNVEAPNTVVMVSNPYCQPCAGMHTQIEYLLNNFDSVQVRIVFAGGDITELAPGTIVHRHLMAISTLSNRAIIRTALKDWFALRQKNYHEWAKNYPVSFDENNVDQLIKQSAWVKIAGISSTPTLLLNGYKVPKIYQLKDLKYILSEAL